MGAQDTTRNDGHCLLSASCDRTGQTLVLAGGIAFGRSPSYARRMGTLYYGDNLDFLRWYLKDETVDLVYLYPPFNSAKNYNAFVHEGRGINL